MVLSAEQKQLIKKTRFVSVDPGITTAIQFWNCGKPGCTEVHKVSKGIKEIPQAIAGLLLIMDFSSVDYMVIEGVDFRVSSEVSIASAARGNLSYLAYIVGAIICKAQSDSVYIFPPVTYSQWAGQLNYGQLRRILAIKYGFTAKNDHEAAAHGIGLWAMGEL